MSRITLGGLFLQTAFALAPSGPWEDFHYAPDSKTVYPVNIYKSAGEVSNAQNLVSRDQNSYAKLTPSEPTSWVAVDFGIEVGGLITMNIKQSNSSELSISFSESPVFVRPYYSDDSSYPSANTTYDGHITVAAQSGEYTWTQPAETLRGGFRYLTIAVDGVEPVDIANISCAISFMPHVEDLRAYTGYFYAKDEQYEQDSDFLTKLWYAGAYTVQTNTVPLQTGRKVPFAHAGTWYNNASLGVAGPIIVDGAKRDRAVWPGDMGIAVPVQLVSTYDLVPTRNALSTMFAAINPRTGALPESGPPLSQLDSDTYHMWTLIGTYNYFLYTEDTTWLQTVWSNYTKAVDFVERKVDYSGTGLMNVTGLRDWARLGGGGFNAEGNAILYRVLTTASSLAEAIDQPELSSAYTANATRLKARFNDAFWMEDVGMFKDNLTDINLYPQDANSLAVVFNLTLNDTQNSRISEGLEGNWGEFGAVAPELPDTVSPFIGGFELEAHYISGNDERALELLRREWGYMLYTNHSVQSTLLEGFTANGSLSYRSYRGYNYDPAYTSHAHGWSAGPTSILTFFTLGLSITSPRGHTWSVAPHVLGGINDVQGGFETSLGSFGVNWTLSASGVFELGIQTPEDSSGIVKLPRSLLNNNETGVIVELDGEETQYSLTGGLEVSGGHHELVVRNSTSTA